MKNPRNLKKGFQPLVEFLCTQHVSHGSTIKPIQSKK